MQINNSSIFYPPVTTEQRNQSNRLPVVVDSTTGQAFQNAVRQYRTSDVVDSKANANNDYQQAQFVRASARVAINENGSAQTKLPKSVQHYLQISAMSDVKSSQTSGLIDEKV